MPNVNNKILKYNYGEKSLKAPFLISFDNEVLLPKMSFSQNNPKKSYTEKKSKHIPSGCAWSLTCSFDLTKNKHGYFRGEDCIKSLREKFKELTLKIINYEEKEMIPLTEEEKEVYKRQEVCHICKEEFCADKNDKNKVRDHCNYTGKFRGAAHSICNLRYKVPKEIPIVAHNAAYDHHFVIKQLAEEFGGQFECIGENNEKYLTFSVPIKKELDNGKTTTYKLKFIDSFRFMPTSLSKLVDNVSDRLQKDKCKDCESKLSYMSVKDN